MDIFDNVLDVFSETVESVGQRIGAGGDRSELAVQVARANVDLARQKQKAEIERAQQMRKLVENVTYILVVLIVVAVIAAIAYRFQK